MRANYVTPRELPQSNGRGMRFYNNYLSNAHYHSNFINQARFCAALMIYATGFSQGAHRISSTRKNDNLFYANGMMKNKTGDVNGYTLRRMRLGFRDEETSSAANFCCQVAVTF